MIKFEGLRRINFPLIIGSLLLLLFVITSFYPDLLATADPYGKQRLEFQSAENGKSSFMIPPIPPSKEYPWGTDHLGRDIKSLIIYGCKMTILIAVLTSVFRLLIALPMAISAAYNNKLSLWFIKQFNILFSAFPLIVIVIMLSKLSILKIIFKDNYLITALLLTVFGWSKLAYLLMEKVNEILSQDFVEGEIAIGKSKLEIAVQNVLPHLIPSLMVLFFLEIALVLQVMAQIGIFSLITSGGYVNTEGDLNVPFEFDWASLLVFAYMFFGTDKMYLVIFPAAAFAVSIIGFNLFGEGLRIEFDKRTSRVITLIRRIPSYISPFRLIYEIKNFPLFKRTVYTKLICYTLVLGVAFFPQPPSLFRFDSVNAFKTIEELSSEKYKGRLAGTPENKELASHIAEELKSYGIKPFDDSYIHEFDIKSSINIKDASFKVFNSSAEEKEYEFRKEFVVTSPYNISGTFELEKLGMKELYDINQAEYNALMSRGLYKKIIMLDLQENRDPLILNRVMQALVSFVRPKAIVFLSDKQSSESMSKQVILDKLFKNTALIILTKEVGDELQRMKNTKVELSIQADVYKDTKGYNVFGFIKGTDESKKNEYIVIGSRVDYVGDDKYVRFPGALSAGSTAAALEIAKKLAESNIRPKQNIVFAFWDGSYSEDRGSSYFVKKYIMRGNIDSVTYIDIGSLALRDEDTILLDTSKVFPKNKDAQTYISILKKNARKQGIKLAYGRIYSPLMTDLVSRNIQSILISNVEKEIVSTTSEDTMDKIDRKQYKKIGQMLLDTIIDIAKGE